jgi:hypothetical protein
MFEILCFPEINYSIAVMSLHGKGESHSLHIDQDLVALQRPVDDGVP